MRHGGLILPSWRLMISRCLGHRRLRKLCERLAQRDGLIESLRAELGAALVRIAELEARLGQTTSSPTAA